MGMLVHNLSEVFAVSIIHSLWQCLLIYLIVRILLADIIHISAAAKHNITLGAMLLSAVWFVYTLFDQAGHYSWHFVPGQPGGYTPHHLPLIVTIKEFAKANDNYELVIEQYLPYISIVYGLGLLFHVLKFIFGWLQIRQIKRSGSTDMLWQQKLNKLAALLDIKKLAFISITDKIDVPCITGYLKPVILIPISLTTHLSVSEVEAILLHELAHVKRNDYLLNLLQQVISVVLFFNPFVALMNRIINRERENSCDDMVVAVTGAPLVYAHALLKLEENNPVQWRLALAANGKNKFHLLNRIERIMKTKKPMANIRHLVMAFTILAITIVSIAWFSPAIGNGRISVKKIKPILESLFADTTKVTHKKAVATTGKKRPSTVNHSKVYINGHAYYEEGFDDPKLDKMSEQMDKYGQQMEAFYNDPKYKKLQENMEAYGKQMEDYYNSDTYKKIQQQMEDYGKQMQDLYNDPKLKQLQAAQEKLGHDFEKEYGYDSETAKLGEEMGKLGDKIGSYYNSKEFKEYNRALRKKYGIPEDENYIEDRKYPNFQQYEDEMRAHTPADILAATAELKTMGEKMRKHSDNPAMREKSAQMRAMGDSLRSMYQNPKLKEIQEQMRQAGEQMRAYTNDAAMKQVQEQMRQAGQQMRVYTNNAEMKELQHKMRELGEQIRAYTNTPEFKKKVKEWERTHPGWSYNYNDNDNHNQRDSMNISAPAPPPAPVAVPNPPANN